MATLAELAGFKHHAVRSDGAKFLDGVRNDNLDTSWLSVVNGKATLQKGLYDELLVVKGEVADDQIKTWAAMQSPFYDPASNVTYEGSGGRFEIDQYGERAIRNSDGKVMRSFDLETGEQRFAGHVEADSGYFRGRIEAEEGYFRGDITGASGTFGGSLKAKVITADMYSEIRNVLPYTGLDSLDEGNPIDYDFYIPSETTKIISVKLSAMGLPFRSYSRGAAATTPASRTVTSTYWDFSGATTASGGVHSHSYDPRSGWNRTDPDGNHTHTFNIPNHSHDVKVNGVSHSHDNVPGIYLGTTPSSVNLYCDNGSGWGSAISLGSGAILATELDITNRFSGTGWKRVRFTSGRLGRITWQIVVKVDLTA